MTLRDRISLIACYALLLLAAALILFAPAVINATEFLR